MSAEGVNESGPMSEIQPVNKTGKGEGKAAVNPDEFAEVKEAPTDISKLKKSAPEIWKQMMMAMATEMINKWKKHPEKLKEIRRENERK